MATSSPSLHLSGAALFSVPDAEGLVELAVIDALERETGAAAVVLASIRSAGDVVVEAAEEVKSEGAVDETSDIELPLEVTAVSACTVAVAVVVPEMPTTDRAHDAASSTKPTLLSK